MSMPVNILAHWQFLSMELFRGCALSGCAVGMHEPGRGTAVFITG